MSKPILNQMSKICSVHYQRGEQILEFNISPDAKKIVGDSYWYRGTSIPIVSENWIKLGDFYYKKLQTSEGVMYTKNILYRLK